MGKHLQGSNRHVDVRDFGAKGDGSTDNAQAIRDLLGSLDTTDVYGTTGGVVRCPAGDYLIGSEVRFGDHAGLTFIGDGIVKGETGRAATRFIYSGTDNNEAMFNVSPSSTAASLLTSTGTFDMTSVNGETLTINITSPVSASVSYTVDTSEDKHGVSGDPVFATPSAATVEELAYIIGYYGETYLRTQVVDSKVKIILKYPGSTSTFNVSAGNVATELGLSTNAVYGTGVYPNNNGRTAIFHNMSFEHTETWEGRLIYFENVDVQFHGCSFDYERGLISGSYSHGPYSAIGIECQQAEQLLLRDCNFDHLGIGLYVPNHATLGLNDTYIENCMFRTHRYFAIYHRDAGSHSFRMRGGGCNPVRTIATTGQDYENSSGKQWAGIYVASNAGGFYGVSCGGSQAGEGADKYYLFTTGRGVIYGSWFTQDEGSIGVIAGGTQDIRGNYFTGDPPLYCYGGMKTGGGNYFQNIDGETDITACLIGSSSRTGLNADYTGKVWGDLSGTGTTIDFDINEFANATSGGESFNYSYQSESTAFCLGEIKVNPQKDASTNGASWVNTNNNIFYRYVGRQMQAKTTDHTITNLESGAMFSNVAATNAVTFSLPLAAHKGFRARIFNANGELVVVSGVSSDTIEYDGSSYTVVSGVTKGSSVVLVAGGSGSSEGDEWIIESISGSWGLS